MNQLRIPRELLVVVVRVPQRLQEVLKLLLILKVSSSYSHSAHCEVDEPEKLIGLEG